MLSVVTDESARSVASLRLLRDDSYTLPATG
jgi:hypothetical protein